MAWRSTARSAAARREALNNLYAWYREWTEIARAPIKRRDHLIRLGLASRRSPSDGKDPVAPDAGGGADPVDG